MSSKSEADVKGDQLDFQHERIDSSPPSGRLGSCTVTDLTGNGRPDVIVGGLGDPKEVSFLGRNLFLRSQPLFRPLIKQRETNLFWYENPGWKRHKMANSPPIDVSATMGDITGDGRLDFLAGQGTNQSELYWFEHPSNPRTKWTQHLITNSFQKYHDVGVGDVDNDCSPEVVALSQESEKIFYYDIPEDPRKSPWPESNCHIIADGLELEGLKITDIDNDGQQELLAGPNVFQNARKKDQYWDYEAIAPGWKWTRLAVSDLDGDGELEIVLAEGDRPYADGQMGRVGWFDPPGWSPNLLGDEFFCPHSLQTADFTGNGLDDIYIAEMGLGENEDPRHVLYLNKGKGEFKESLLFSGIPTHEAKVVDLTGDGTLDIVGKSYSPTHHVDVWYNQS